jgi:hypothetical protein
LVSFLLVLAAAVTLVVGLLQSGLTLIYLSIGCSVVAGLVLAVAVLRGRPEPKAASVAPARPYSPPPTPTPSYSSTYEPEPADESWRVDTPAPAAATRRFGRPAAVAVEPDEEPEPSPIAGYARRAMSSGASTSTVDLSAEFPGAPAARGPFPIPDYDDLRAPELLRRVDELDVAALEQVRAREASGKNRVSVLSRIDSRLETLRGPGWDIDEATWEGGDEAPAPAEADLDDDFDDGAATGDGFPIADYDGLRVGQILPLLRDLEPSELEEVRAYEASGKARSGILDRIEFLAAGGVRPTVTAAAEPPPPPARRAAATVEAPAPAPAAGGSSAIAAAVAAAKAKQAKKG